MGKMRVYELAKELNIQNKDIIAYLEENGVKGKVPANTLEEDIVAKVKQKFAAGASKAVEAKAPAAKVDEAKAPAAEKTTEPKETAPAEKTAEPKESAPAAKGEESPKKKKRIVIVGNPQHSKSGMGASQNKQNKQQDKRGQKQPAAPKSEISAEQVAAKFKAVLGEGKSKQPANSNVNSAVNKENVAQPAAKTEQRVDNRVENRPVAEAERKTEIRTENRNDNRNEQRNEARGENRQAGERRNDGRGENRQGGERRNDNRGENRQAGERRNDGRGENRQGGERRNDNRGENRQGGFSERRNDNRGENRGEGRQGGFSERRNDNRGENRQAGFGERRNDNRGENRQGGYGERRNDNRGENRQNGYGERRNDNRGDNRQGGFNNDRRNDNRNNDNRQGGFAGRPVFDKDKEEARQTRPGQGSKKQTGSRNSGGFGDVAPAKDTKRDERRTSGQEKDRKNKKDYIYDEENTNVKGRNNKAGKFIKPEKKVEVIEEQIKVIQLPETITIKDLAEKMKMQPSNIIKKLFMQGKIVTVNHEVSYEEAEEIAMEYEILCEKEVKVDVIEELLKEEEEGEDVLVKRPPVICVMGHVDHGKTSLLDAIRKTHVTDKEAGGITQHIGAYTVKTASGERITFLDTPGHEAFTAMRMRGANATDIAILVVAADDGVMPQTVEAINHAKAAGIEIIVAINKIDKPGANIDRVKQMLTEYELVAEDWGGSTVMCPVSAKKGEGIEDLLEMILLTAEVLELKANPKRQARGLVIEAQLDKGRGPVATVLVQKGTLHVGDFISAGACYGKVRAMIDDKGRRLKEAGPSTPVEILGLSDVPEAGEVFLSHDSDKTAKSYAETYMAEYKARMLEETKKRMSLDDLFGQIQAGNLKELNIIIKADVQGSVEAVKQSLTKLSNEEVVVKCIHGGVGLINESDVVLASASNAIIIGFNSRPDATAKTTAEREGVEIKLYRVIYQAIEDIERAMKGMLDPVYEEKVIGHAEVRQIFKASAVGNIAGSYILDGVFQRGCKVRISREGEQIYEGELASLKRFKDDVKEVKAGFECGLVFEGFDQMKELDIVEAYTMVEVPR